MANVEHSIPVVIGARAVAKKDGIEVRRDVDRSTEEVVCLLTWPQIDHLRALVFDQR